MISYTDHPLQRLLEELGPNIAEIRATLQRFGIRGRRGSPRENPIAEWLRHEKVPGDITVTQANTRANDRLWQTPDLISDFIRLFDKGEFPELES